MDTHNEEIRAYIKKYYPEYEISFSAGEVTTMLSDIVGYTGDLLKDYTEYNFNESLITTVTDKVNLYELAQSNNIKPRLKKNSYVEIAIKILIPAADNNINEEGVSRLPIIKPYSVFSTSSNYNVEYTYPYFIDFNDAEKTGAITTIANDSGGEVIYHEYKKNIIAISGSIKEQVFTAPIEPLPYLKVELIDSESTYINSIKDSEDNIWYETDTLGNSIVTYTEQEGENIVIKTIDTEYRFITYIEDDKTFIIFGGGMNVQDSSSNISYDPSRSIYKPIYDKGIDYDVTLNDKSSTYGLAPNNTTLYIEYITGGGIDYNILSNQIDKISSFESSFYTEYSNLLDLVSVTNPTSSFGGGDEDSIERVRNNTLKGMISNKSCITDNDYEFLLLNGPSYLGHIEKVKAYKNSNNSNIDIYLLNKDSKSNYTYLDLSLDNHLTQNIYNYINLYQTLSDNVVLYNTHIINIGIGITIKVNNLKSNTQIQLQVIDIISKHLNSDNMNIGDDINISEIISNIMKLEDVNNVIDFEITNLVGEDYSDILYNVDAAREGNIVFTSIEPSIFEIKYPDIDINVKVI